MIRISKVEEWKIENVVKKIPNTNGIVKKADYSTKIKEIENKLPSFTGLVTTAALKTNATEIEKKIPDTQVLLLLLHLIN